MNKKALEDAFNKMWALAITDLKINMLENSISLKLQSPMDDDKIHFELIFSGVSAYYFFNDMEISRKRFIEYEEGNWLELTSIDYMDEECEMKFNTNVAWLKQFGGSANIVIEIWSRFMFIEATKVIIDGQVFELV